MTELKPKVAIASDVLDNLRELPSKSAAKVSKFIERFRANPRQSGINYEHIQNARDDNFRSVRIDRDLRGIVLAPEKGNVYVLVHVAHHDDAYKWALRRVARVNEATASLQIFSVAEQPAEEAPEAPSSEQRASLFHDLKDRHLTRLGVPQELFRPVRAVKGDADLEQLEQTLPPEAYEALLMKAAGYTYEQVISELDTDVADEPYARDDFAAALASIESQGKYWVDPDENELQRMLEAPLEKWRVFLHPSQRKLVERDWKGPVRVLGGAGTGKTVAAMHRARWLLANRFTQPEDKVLFTTFSTNLAADLRANLQTICSEEQMARLEVANLDSWVYAFLKKLDESRTLVFPGSDALDDIWNDALSAADTHAADLDETFFRYEWDHVIQPNSVDSLEEYLRTPRIGRGKRLDRKTKAQAWKVFAEYRARLLEEDLIEPSDAYRVAREAISVNPNAVAYKAVIVDEAQDMGPEAFRLLGAISACSSEANNLFIVGDGHQRIYGKRAVLGRCGINIRGRSRKLRLNYRTSDEIRKWALAVLEGVEIDDLDEGQDDFKGYRSLFHGPKPAMLEASSHQQEMEQVLEWIERLTSKEQLAHKNICLMVRDNHVLAKVAEALKERKIKTLQLTRRKRDDRQREGVRLSTMHRAKGLEFMAVALVSMNDNIIPSKGAIKAAPDTASKEAAMNSERMLVHVAATRAKKWLLVSSSDKRSRLLKPEASTA